MGMKWTVDLGRNGGWRCDKALLRALVAEFLGCLLFQIMGATAADGAIGNGISLAVLVYMTAPISGGHLNPAVSLALFVTGHHPLPKLIFYTLAQVGGCFFGAMISAGLASAPVGAAANRNGPGCLGTTWAEESGIVTTSSGIFGWEVCMTFMLVMVIYATAVDKPGAGPAAPAAIGLTLLACAEAGGGHGLNINGRNKEFGSGGALNPARVLGPAMIFGCGWSNARMDVYILGEYFGAFLAAIIYKGVFMSRHDDEDNDSLAGSKHIQLAQQPGGGEEDEERGFARA